MTLIFQSGLSGGSRKISGAHSCSWPMQKGHFWLGLGLGFEGDLDLKSEGRLALAGEKMTHRFVTASFLSWGLRPPDAINLHCTALHFVLFYFCLIPSLLGKQQHLLPNNIFREIITSGHLLSLRLPTNKVKIINYEYPLYFSVETYAFKEYLISFKCKIIYIKISEKDQKISVNITNIGKF